MRACDVEAGEVVKMSHMASATHASPSRSSGREEDGTEATDEAGGEACGVGVVVRWVVQRHNGLHSQRGGVMASLLSNRQCAYMVWPCPDSLRPLGGAGTGIRVWRSSVPPAVLRPTALAPPPPAKA